MRNIFRTYENEIKEYCRTNDLDFNIVKTLPKCWNKDYIWFQYHDKNKGKKGLNEEEPMPIVLIININQNTLSFEKTEYTNKYIKLQNV